MKLQSITHRENSVVTRGCGGVVEKMVVREGRGRGVEGSLAGDSDMSDLDYHDVFTVV